MNVECSFSSHFTAVDIGDINDILISSPPVLNTFQPHVVVYKHCTVDQKYLLRIFVVLLS